MLRVIPSEGVVSETDNPAMVFRSNPRASIFVCSGLVKMGHANAFVSMGSTGASIAAATVTYGTMSGIARGCLGGPIIGYSPNTVIIDLGANIDIRPQQLADFGTLGSVMSRIMYGQENPRIALLNVGSEDTKGNELVKGTVELLKKSRLNFIGMLEPYDLPHGRAEVVLCDGFVGNIVLKLTEGLGKVISEHVRKRTGDNALAGEIYSLTNSARNLWWRSAARSERHRSRRSRCCAVAGHCNCHPNRQACLRQRFRGGSAEGVGGIPRSSS